ncbi:MAG: hypothetical protein M1326_10705, partial [Cyanobacteria bacterium]|nr:hypothetical protein [Cyanobacteriota bacterium]
MTKIKLILIFMLLTVFILGMLAVNGCAQTVTETTAAAETTAPAETTSAAETTVAEIAEEEVTEETISEYALELGETKTRGPKGQVPIWYNQISLTAEEKEQVKQQQLCL